MSTIAEQIGAFEAKRAANQKAMEDIMAKSATEGATLDASEQEDFDGLFADNEAIDGHLKRLRVVEKSAAEKAKPVQTVEKSAAAVTQRAGIVLKAPKLEPGFAFARLARVKGLAKLSGESPRDVAKELYGEESEVYSIVTKAAVPAGSTATGNWAKPLVGTETDVFADFVEFLRPMTILGKFGANGIPSLRRVPFRVPLIGQTAGGDGYWVGQGKAKPLTQFGFERKTLEPLKVANIAAVTEELLRDSSPSADMLIRDSLAAALRERLDRDFVNPAKAPAANVSPGSITNGVTAVVSGAGAGADGVRDDVRALMNAFIAANNAPTDGVWIMPATTALALSMMVNPLGQSEFPGINMNGGTFFGLPVITSQYMPVVVGVGAGAFVALVNASDVYMADDGDINVDMSREASLEMDNAPTHDSTTPTAAQMVSMWQTNSVAFRAERTLNWMRRRDSGVQLLSQVTWN